jgi:undecaprenyl diphosphate synthase
MTNEERLPRHVGIIMDGNGRWAKKNKLRIALGHRQGVEVLRDIIRETSDLGIEALSIYAFSTENWSRSPMEVNALMDILLEFFTSEIDELYRKNVRVRILGNKNGLPPPQRDAVIQAEERTRTNTGLALNIALNYGTREELLNAVRDIALRVTEHTLAVEDITQQTLADSLYSAGLPDVDLLIRTGGEMRLSNFMLYQCAYAELLFLPVLWPDFTLEQFHDALLNFQSRDRRYGGRKV